MSEEKIILSTSDEAAQFVTNISGWVARGGRFWGDDERMARYDGCTHRACTICGMPVEKITGHTVCQECRDKKETDDFNALPRKQWDGETPLTLWRGDEYFFTEDELLEWCEDHETTPQELQLVICKPNYAREIDLDGMYCDDLPEDQYLDDVAPELADMLKEVNTYIREKKIILSWGPSRIAAIIQPASSEPKGEGHA